MGSCRAAKPRRDGQATGWSLANGSPVTAARRPRSAGLRRLQNWLSPSRKAAKGRPRRRDGASPSRPHQRGAPPLDSQCLRETPARRARGQRPPHPGVPPSRGPSVPFCVSASLREELPSSESGAPKAAELALAKPPSRKGTSRRRDGASPSRAPSSARPTSPSASLRLCESPHSRHRRRGARDTPASLLPRPLSPFASQRPCVRNCRPPSLGLRRLQSWLAPSRQAAKGRAGDGMEPRHRVPQLGAPPRAPLRLCASARAPTSRHRGRWRPPHPGVPPSRGPPSPLRLCVSNCWFSESRAPKAPELARAKPPSRQAAEGRAAQGTEPRHCVPRAARPTSVSAALRLRASARAPNSRHRGRWRCPHPGVPPSCGPPAPLRLCVFA